MQKHVFIIGSKSIGQYGGYESFVMNLLQQHEKEDAIKYHVACKKNGSGFMNLNKLPGSVKIDDKTFAYCNSEGFMVKVPDKLGSFQAIYYDIKALKWCCKYIKRHRINNPIVYILASRIGPFEKRFVRAIHSVGGKVYQNPDGHEDWRAKWNFLVRKYWKLSERFAVKRADLIVCDSKSIEKYILNEYAKYKPKTTFIAYGSYVSDQVKDSSKLEKWLDDNDLKKGEYYTIVGRFVPENNFETIIKEFMNSHTSKKLAIITTKNDAMMKLLEQRLHFSGDERVKFVGTVYDSELLTAIRQNAYGYFHGHSVGGTNPSLLEALGTTNLNLLYDVGFNREVAENAAYYWTLEEGNLANLIDQIDDLRAETIEKMGDLAKKRISEEYSWQNIADKYKKIFL